MAATATAATATVALPTSKQSSKIAASLRLLTNYKSPVRTDDSEDASSGRARLGFKASTLSMLSSNAISRISISTGLPSPTLTHMQLVHGTAALGSSPLPLQNACILALSAKLRQGHVKERFSTGTANALFLRENSCEKEIEVGVTKSSTTWILTKNCWMAGGVSERQSFCAETCSQSINTCTNSSSQVLHVRGALYG